MAIGLTIGGVARYWRVGSLTIATVANGRATASFEVRSNDATYRPALGDEVIITEGATRVFGGVVDRTEEAGVLGDETGAYTAITTRVSAVDFNQLAERRVIPNGGFPAGYSLLQALTALVAWVAPYGVTLDPSQVTGPTGLPELNYPYVTLKDAYDQLASLTANYGDPYIWEIDFFKVMRMYQPATVAAPFDITEGDGRTVGDVIVDQARDLYANRIYLLAPTQVEAGRVESFTGDGSTDAFELLYTPTDWMRGVVDVDGVSETLTTTEFAGEATWTYDKTTNTITRETGAPTVGATIEMTFNGIYDPNTSAEDPSATAGGGVNVWERVRRVDGVPSDMDVMANGYLQEALVIPKYLKYITLETGLAPGQTQHITLPSRDVDDDATITEVVLRDYRNASQFLRQVQATTGTTVQDGWREVIANWSKDRVGGTGAISGGTTVTTGAGAPGQAAPAPPLRSIQYNDEGRFGGQADWLFDETTTTVMLGLDHTEGGSTNLLIGEGHTVN
jgi:hypothetical protein